MNAASFLSSPRLRGEGAEPRSGEAGEGRFMFCRDFDAPAPPPGARDHNPHAGRGKGV
jgi:hypothetical protein